MFERILVPLDGTPLAEQALPLAVSVARAAGAHLDLATVLSPPLIGLRELPSDASLGEVEADYLDTVASRVRDAGVPDVSTKLLKHKDVVGALEAHRVDEGAGLTVMCSHGRGSFERAWLGSVADRFLRTSEAPVLLVRAAPAEEREQDLRTDVSFRRVLIALDGSALSEAAVAPAWALARSGGTTYVLARVIEPPLTPPSDYLLPMGFEFPEEIVEAARRDADSELGAIAESGVARGFDVETVTQVATPAANGILDIAESRDVDLIAIATHGRGGVRRLVLGSVADKVIRGANCPILVVRPQEG